MSFSLQELVPHQEPSPQAVSFSPHAEPLEPLLEQFGVHSECGLSSQEAEKRLKVYGSNTLPEPPKPHPLLQFLRQFNHPLVLVLLGAALVATLQGASQSSSLPFLLRYGDALSIFLIVFFNAGLGYYQERKAEFALHALKKLQQSLAHVRRDNHVLTLPTELLVVGDVLELEAGDAIPADARLVQSVALATVESSLTGESTSVYKNAAAAVPAHAPLGERSTMVFLGTNVVQGKGRAVVVATGTATELGRLSKLLLQANSSQPTLLQEKLDRFGKRLLWVCFGLSALLFSYGLLRQSRHWSELLLEAVSLAVAAIPEGLPAITTITLALGMQRMAKRGAVVRNLSAVETLGAATVICSDKTGTLTQNEMTVREVYAGSLTYDVTGIGYQPSGQILEHNNSSVSKLSNPLCGLLTTAVLCNNARLTQGEEPSIVGDPTEAALLVLARKGGVERTAFTFSVAGELPFDSDRKRMSVLIREEGGTYVVHSKGSAEALLPFCSAYATESGVVLLDEKLRQTILEQVEQMSHRALRVLAFARRELPADTTNQFLTAEQHLSLEIEQNFTFLGLVGMTDPLRPNAKEAVAACAKAGVRTTMITGDHKLTAMAIAKELGLWDPKAKALSGTELEQLSEKELQHHIESIRVFARVTAEQKVRIVQALKTRGHIVAMTGDGVNDAPALREAHIGVAMGKSGTDVAREAADIVIADDNFATLVEAVREGRSIYRNIQKSVFFLLSSNAGLVLTVMLGPFVPGYQPLSPLMILWINLVTNGLPALALGLDPPDSNPLHSRPHKAKEGLLRIREYVGIAVIGLFMSGFALLGYMPFMHAQASLYPPESQGRVLAFSLLAFSPLFHALSCRSATHSVVNTRPFLTPIFLLFFLVSLLLQLIAVLVPSLRPVFRTVPLSVNQWLFLLILSAAIIPIMELTKAVERRWFAKR